MSLVTSLFLFHFSGKCVSKSELLFFSVNIIKSYETQHLTLFCGESGPRIRKDDRLKWERGKTGHVGGNKTVTVNTSRSYQERLDFESLTLMENGELFSCGEKSVELKVLGAE